MSCGPTLASRVGECWAHVATPRQFRPGFAGSDVTDLPRVRLFALFPSVGPLRIKARHGR